MKTRPTILHTASPTYSNAGGEPDNWKTAAPPPDISRLRSLISLRVSCRIKQIHRLWTRWVKPFQKIIYVEQRRDAEIAETNKSTLMFNCTGPRLPADTACACPMGLRYGGMPPYQATYTHTPSCYRRRLLCAADPSTYERRVDYSLLRNSIDDNMRDHLCTTTTTTNINYCSQSFGLRRHI